MMRLSASRSLVSLFHGAVRCALSEADASTGTQRHANAHARAKDIAAVFFPIAPLSPLCLQTQSAKL
jgi:hypothetical protein